ncbi:hypothetical protein FQ775_00160 [Nitratireductor mangrovi]|uniref:Uncharacterized protein n=1 Tax=Nitratireductor mangrovi TaxID=2599600 RepID=A0A5B8KTN7_9HYPH|nr:hypothetical protein [Nitratireductor mangrovi]QDY98913.1 hypothetical protein FQ775_00160 [Nitratireductor mangrovi]
MADFSSWLIFFDDRLGAAVFCFDTSIGGLSSAELSEIYGNLCTMQERSVESAILSLLHHDDQKARARLALTWSFSINIIKIADKIEMDAESMRQFVTICGGSDLGGHHQFDSEEVLHLVGATGSLAIVIKDSPKKKNWQRIIGLWTAFYSYYAASINDYSRLARENANAPKKHTRRQLLESIRYHDESYRYITSRISLFDPLSICTRSFDSQIYENCWKTLDVESDSVKLERMSNFFLESARGAQAELTRRYERVVELVLFLLAFTQVLPIFEWLIGWAANLMGMNTSIDGTKLAALAFSISLFILVYIYAYKRSN